MSTFGGAASPTTMSATPFSRFEIDPEDIGTSRFDERVSRNLKTIINIAEEEYPHLSTYEDIEPHVWRSIFLDTSCKLR
jgi:hypothetical protein